MGADCRFARNALQADFGYTEKWKNVAGRRLGHSICPGVRSGKGLVGRNSVIAEKNLRGDGSVFAGWTGAACRRSNTEKRKSHLVLPATVANPAAVQRSCPFAGRPTGRQSLKGNRHQTGPIRYGPVWLRYIHSL